MAKKLVLAVAGSGKTSRIVNSLSLERRSLIVTYTNENLRSIQSSVIERFGHIPNNLLILSYFSFLYSFCFRPFFSYDLRDKSYTWEMPPNYPGSPQKHTLRHYMTPSGYLYSNRVSKYILEFGGVPKVVGRLEKYFDDLYIDEVQDFGGSDFNFLMMICQAKVNMLFVGDYFQHTFDTSRDGNIRTNLHKNGLESYIAQFRSAGCDVDMHSLGRSHRCSRSVCDFIRVNTGVHIESSRSDDTKIVIVADPKDAESLFLDDSKVKLFYQDSRKYPCRSNNWGKSKGLNDYMDVCVVLNKTTHQLFSRGLMTEMSESTRNKLYVACSRARGDLFIIDEAHLQKFKKL